MNNSLLLDTDILVNVGRGKVEVISQLNEFITSEPVHISAVTEMELIIGCRNKTELRDLAHLIERFVIVPITPEISSAAIKLLKTYRLSHGLLIADALIAATALVTDLILVSGNAKHFSMVKGLKFRSA